jgi:signal transduction histidine kinase
MLRSACIFLAAILLPSLVLAWLAVRSARDQQVLIEHQQAIISQDVTDTLAKNVRDQIDTMRSGFVQITQDLLSKSANAQAEAENFDRNLRDQWPPANVGFAVDLRGAIYSPGNNDGPAARTFREENERFLTNRENVEAYSSLKSQALVTKQIENAANADTTVNSTRAQNAEEVPLTPPPKHAAHPASPEVPIDSLAPSGGESSTFNVNRAAVVTSTSTPSTDEAPTKSDVVSGSDQTVQDTADARQKAVATGSISSVQAPAPATSDLSMETASAASPAATTPPAAASPAPDATYRNSQLEGKAAKFLNNQVARQVSPQNNFDPTTAILSNTVPEESDFKKLIGSDTSGAIARFLDNKLQLLFWFHPPTASDLVFGAQLNQGLLIEKLQTVLQAPELQQRDSSFSRTPASYCLALLDDAGHPVAVSIPGFTTDWKHPFVATEIGETLPHWEAALYLTDPQQFSKSARTLRLTVVLIVLLLVVAIVAGGSLIAADIRRQVRVAQQKTDFVSNVSHELKTPLTSIRMFADLLAEGRVTEPERQSTYLKIISAESARLTRLINNVLDFARQERGVSTNERRACDLVETARDVVETCLPHLEASGQGLTCEIEAESLPIIGDRDALAQIVLNLISNAEKYGGGEILVRIRRQETSSGALGCVDVLDRGPGIPPKQVESIFLPFHRLDDSLSSGIPGSGLGLTLSRRMARVHGGDITYTPRAGGGSCFTLTVPLTKIS